MKKPWALYTSDAFESEVGVLDYNAKLRDAFAQAGEDAPFINKTARHESLVIVMTPKQDESFVAKAELLGANLRHRYGG